MLLAVDIGNTNTVFAVHDGRAFRANWRSKTDFGRSADEYAALLSRLFSLENLDFKAITEIVVSSVVPEADVHFDRLFARYFKARTHRVEVENIAVPIKLARPEEVGSDRLVNVVGALSSFDPPIVIVDFGTATTFDVIDSEGAYCGGAIAPGVNLSMNALHHSASKLPKISVVRPDRAIGTDTVSAMQSGLYWGYMGLIEGMLDKIEVELQAQPTVLATGGLAPLFAQGTDRIAHIDEILTLKGLIEIHTQQRACHAA